MDFFKEVDKAVNRMSKKPTVTNINKQIKDKKMTIMAEPKILAMALTHIQLKMHPKYNEFSVTSLIQNFNIFYTQHSVNEFDGNSALSLSYKNLYFDHSTEGKVIFNSLWNCTFLGNKKQGYCSSYVRKSEPKGTTFIGREYYRTLLLQVIKSEVTMEQYTSLFNARVTKQSKKGKVIESLVKHLDLSSLEPKTKVQKTNKHFLSKTLNSTIIERAKTYLDSLIQYQTDMKSQGKKYNARSTNSSISAVKQIINTSVLNTDGTFTMYYTGKKSIEAGRTFHVLNQSSKAIRKALFGDYIELDINNMASTFLTNKFSDLDIDILKFYTKNNTNKNIVRNKVKDELNITLQEAKTLLQSVSFGSTKYTLKSQTLGLVRGAFYRIAIAVKQKHKLRTMKSAFTKMSRDFMLEETRIIEELLKEMNINKKQVIDIHDGILIPKDLLTLDTVNQIKTIESKFNYSFSGKRTISNYLKNEFLARKSLGTLDTLNENQRFDLYIPLKERPLTTEYFKFQSFKGFTSGVPSEPKFKSEAGLVIPLTSLVTNISEEEVQIRPRTQIKKLISTESFKITDFLMRFLC